MSTKGSVFQKGGGGTNFEQAVQTAFITTLICRGNAPSIPSNELTEVAFQTTNRGYQTDDLLVIANSSIGQHRLLFQIKHRLVFSENNDTFNEVIRAFWKDFNNTSIFSKTYDRLLIVTSGLTIEDRNHLKSILNWAKNHSSPDDFYAEVNRINAKSIRLTTFKESLKKANEGNYVTDIVLWGFLRCVDVLDYDFLNEASIDKTYFSNLIKLSKSNDTISNENEIWDSIASFVSRLNTDGGSVTYESIKQEEIYKHFNPSKLDPFFDSIQKLEKDGDIILKTFKNTIGDIHLSRIKTNETILQSINSNNITVITGGPGVGKSAAIKDNLLLEFNHASVLVFRADQFNFPHLANVLSNQGISYSFKDIFSCLSSIPDKIIFIDSLEKLLEGDPENAFKQLLVLLKDNSDIKLILSGRRYSIDLIFQKFNIQRNKTKIIEINPLTKDEFKEITDKYPNLIEAFKNQHLRKLLSSPKYLDFLISAIEIDENDLTEITPKQFKEELWNSLVKSSVNRSRGLPAKREQAFLEIAVNRARMMKLFVGTSEADQEAIEKLENDEIIIQNKLTGEYTPSHDILEDWALVKYITYVYEKYTQPHDFFKNLGNEPALRRAFRLWVEDEIIDNAEYVYKLIRDTIADESIDSYWEDEILIAVFKSDDCSSFFVIFKKELLKDNSALLNRCIHLMRTACKHSNMESNTSLFLIPHGSGWQEIISFIKEHLSQLEGIKLSIANLILDWGYKLVFNNSVLDSEANHVKEILNKFLDEIENEDELWWKKNLESTRNRLITLLFDLAHYAAKEIIDLFERAFKERDNSKKWKLSPFYESVFDIGLSGLNTHILTKELPELVVDTAWKEWKLKPIPESVKDRIPPYLRDSKLEFEKCWGIEDKSHFFPSGIYKTPFYNLLWAHPLVGIKFITEFINYSVEFYVSADCEYKNNIIQIELELNDGTKVTQYASWELWAAYRGSSVTHYCIESLLMSLEKYLLLVAAQKTEISQENIQFLFNYLIRNSNNVAITSVLTSVILAYPEEVGEEMLPLLSVKEFYEWDLSRSTSEFTTLSPYDNQISFAQKERFESNKLPHRRKYLRGLSDFIIDYQFNIGTLNERIHNRLDQFKSKIQNDDLESKKLLTEIDIRNHKIGDYDENLKGFIVQPDYEKDVKEMITSNEGFFQAQSKSLKFSGILKNVYDGDVTFIYSNWVEIQKYYQEKKRLDILYDRPITLANIGLRDFHSELGNDQKKWCIDVLIDSIRIIVEDETNRRFGLNRTINLMEKDIALKSFHLLFNHITEEREKKEIKVLLVSSLLAPFSNHEAAGFTRYIREVIFDLHPNLGYLAWSSLIKTARYREEQKKNKLWQFPDQMEERRVKENEFILETVTKEELDITLDEINLDDYQVQLLVKALCIIPYNTEEKAFIVFIDNLIALILQDFKKEESYSYNRGSEDRRFHFQLIHEAKDYFVETFLNAEIEHTVRIINSIFDTILEEELTLLNYRNDFYDFGKSILESTIYKLDELVSNSTDDDYINKLVNNFWKIWEYLFEKIKSSRWKYYTSTLLLGIEWRKEATDWKPLRGKMEFYYKMVIDLGKYNSQTLLNLFSTAGEKTFLPTGMSWIVELYKKDTEGIEINSLLSSSAERLIRRLFYNHISVIKNNKKLVDDYIWLLNKMVDLGSSDAYFFRENVITYKSYK